jgi:hypothetical protein
MRQTMEFRRSRKDRWGLLAVLSLLATSAFADGSLDPSFGTGGKVRTYFGFDDHAAAVALQADGKLVVAGTAYTDFNTVARFGLTPGTSWATDLARQLDGKLVAVGLTKSTGPGTLDFALARYE